MSVRYTDIKEAIDGQLEAFELFKKSHDERYTSLQDRIEELEARSDRPGRAIVPREGEQHTKCFLDWLRRPGDYTLRQKLAEAQSAVEQKSVTVGSAAGGGYAVPEMIGRDIEARAKTLNPFRGLVTVRTIGTSRYHELVSMSDDAAAWVGEGGTRSETATPTLRDREPTEGTIYSLPKASEESLQDIFFDVRGWLVESAGDTFAASEAAAIVSGNGSDKPTGFLAATPVTTDDDASPLRAAGTLMYVPGYAGSPAALSADQLIEVATASLKAPYLNGEGVAWVMSRTALSLVRQLKDQSGRYVWAESLVPGAPSTLLGYSVFQSDAMPAVSAGSFSIAFGNWRRGYVLTTRANDLRITVDEVTTPGQVRFYIRRRIGGCVRNNDALRAVKFAAS